MSATLEPRGGLYHSWALGESGWNTGMDDNLKRISRFGFHLSVKDRHLNTPPASPAAGDTYIVGPSPTGAWAGKADQIAYWDASVSPGEWLFAVPRTGWLAVIEDELRISGYFSNQSPSGWSNGVSLV